ncbi:hypothetical protein ACJMK2_017061 [Sinanodonta woodiana]|uniref:[Histone H3]-dimethyl-L-lysine(36) demethylase n=1 Tax=Sinanodonta woodiana TaxID=1069815 RepID=A0ABD3UWZ2_SINWO
MASEEDNTVYCICRQPYDETEFMIACDVCKDWFHGSCVGVKEHQAVDIEIYHCPNCQVQHGPLVLKKKRNCHRHDYSESDENIIKAIQTGTVAFIKELKNRVFPSADETSLIKFPNGNTFTKEYIEKNGFDVPVLVEKKDGLGLTVPPANFSIQDVENYVGSMREIDVIDVARQEDYKMLMREWTEYYNSPNRDKIFNVISLEFSGTKLTELVVPPTIVRELSWVSSGVWPDQLPDDCPYTRPEVQKYCLMGVRDSYTDFHIDFGGTSVWYHVLRGEKIFYMIRPTVANLALYESWLSSSNQSEMFLGDQVDNCYKCTIKQGQTIFIPTGWIHAVFTPIDSLVFGGNFLHSYNIPLQSEVYEIERRMHTPEKYLFPSFETINWYAAKHILDILRDYIEDGQSPPPYITDGAKALAIHLKSWTQRKDVSILQFAKNAKHEVPEHIQYGKLLKDLNKEIRTVESRLSDKNSPLKAKKRKKKISVPPKQMQDIDLLHQHTQEKLHEMEMEQKKNIYNFKEEDDDDLEISSPGKLMKVRIPKAGAYFDAKQDMIDDPDLLEKKELSLKLKVSNGKIVSDKLKGRKSGEFQLLVEGIEGTDKLKGKKAGEFKLMGEGNDGSDKLKGRKAAELQLLGNGNETSDKSKGKKAIDFQLLGDGNVGNDKLKGKKAIEFQLLGNGNEASDKLKGKKAIEFQPLGDGNVGNDKLKGKKAIDFQPLGDGNEGSDKDDGDDILVVDENPKKKIKTEPTSDMPASTIKPGSLRLKLSFQGKPPKSETSDESAILGSPSGLSSSQSDAAGSKDEALAAPRVPPGGLSNADPLTIQQTLRMNMPTIRGGLNGSIADILEASGYGTETAFTVDEDIGNAPSPSMREAIQGMLSMSRMGGGMGDLQLFSRSERRLSLRAKSQAALEDEEEHLSKCYQDDEFVYPTLEMSDDEAEQLFKGRGKHDKDESWNPKARVNISVPLGERPHREGARRESIENSLAASAAKLANAPKAKRIYKKKLKLEKDQNFEPQPGTSKSSCLSPTYSASAFRPGLKSFSSSTPESPTKTKKPKKGQATAKQRLGKILKIHKMGLF